MKRYKIIIQYDGSFFSGWQLQSDKRTIQGEVEYALTKINNGTNVRAIGAGRTDSGVHATGQVAHFDIDTNLTSKELLKAINGNINNDIEVKNCIEVSSLFHARFSAIRRHYSYRVSVSDFILDRSFTHHTKKLDLSILNKVAKSINGDKDFTSFSKINKNVLNRRCIIYESLWNSSGEILNYTIVGNRFLHHMVRYLVGTMIEVALGNFDIKIFHKLLSDPIENVNIHKAPSSGLVLTEVEYD